MGQRDAAGVVFASMSDIGNRDSKAARAARLALRALGGWELVGGIPKVDRAVCLAVPHTANLDGVLLVALSQSVGMPISWMVKDTWGKGLTGPFVRGVGGVPIDRSRPNGMVGSMIEEFAKRDRLYLVVPPEGTRSRTEYWKSGFYRIALGANVPVIPAWIDYRTKRGGYSEPIDMTGDVKRDMDAIRAFYARQNPQPRYPAKFGPIRLRDEDEPPADG
jgi:1-acyl-sn-glycerol-3-phosphate acyltransferase